MGNRKKEMTPERAIKRGKTAARINEYRKSNGLTQAQLADRIHVEEHAISRYENQKVDISEGVALGLQRLSGFPAEYWMGVSDARSAEELKEERELKVAVTEISTQLRMAYDEYWSEIQTTFSVCGYRLELDWKATAAAREKESGGSTTEYKVPAVVRKVVDQEDPEHWFHCKDSEIRDILNSMKETIGFWGYKKSRALKSK